MRPRFFRVLSMEDENEKISKRVIKKEERKGKAGRSSLNYGNLFFFVQNQEINNNTKR